MLKVCCWHLRHCQQLVQPIRIKNCPNQPISFLSTFYQPIVANACTRNEPISALVFLFQSQSLNGPSKPIRCELNQRRAYSSIRQERDPYEVLGLHGKASKREIKAAYIRLSKIYHPDRNKDDESTNEFQEISAAYEKLISRLDAEDNQQNQTASSDWAGAGTQNSDWSRSSDAASDWRTASGTDNYWQNRRKTRNFDDWVKNVEKNARIRQKMAAQQRNRSSERSSTSNDYYPGMDDPEYKKFEEKLINHLDRAYYYHKFRMEEEEAKTLAHRFRNYGVLLYLLYLRIVFRIGPRLVMGVFLVLIYLEFSYNDSDFDSPNQTKSTDAVKTE